MAGSDRLRLAAASLPVDLIGHLRGVAERHLKEIDEERRQEEKAESKRTKDLSG